MTIEELIQYKIEGPCYYISRFYTGPNPQTFEMKTMNMSFIILDDCLYITHSDTLHIGSSIVITFFPLNSILSIEAVNRDIVIKSSNRNGVMHITQNKRHVQAYLARNYKWKYYNSLYQKQHKHFFQLEYLRLGLMASLDNFKNEYITSHQCRQN